MRILNALPQNHAYTGKTLSGLCSATIQLATSLSKYDDLEIDILQSQPYDFGESSKIKVFTYKRNRFIPTIKEMAKNYDLIIIHCLQSTMSSIADNFKDTGLERRIVAYLHASYAVAGMSAYFSLDGTYKFLTSNIRIVCPNVEACVTGAINYCNAHNYKIENFDYSKCCELPNTVKDPSFDVNAIQKKDQVIIASRLDSLKNTVMDIKVGLALAARYPGLKVLLTGGNDSGVIKSKQVQEKLAWLAEVKAMHPELIDLGLIDNSALRRHIAESKLLIHLSLAETYSLASAEALSVGTPILGLYQALGKYYSGSAILLKENEINLTTDYLKQAEALDRKFLLRAYEHDCSENTVATKYYSWIKGLANA